MKTKFFTIFIAVSILSMVIFLPVNADEDPTSPLANQTWVRLGGPLGGIGYDIKIDFSSPDIMYVTDAFSGIHKSIDSGITWETLNEDIDLREGPTGDIVPVFCVTVDPNDTSIVWVGLQNQGAVYKSEDGGLSWVRKINGLREKEGLTIRGISVEPGNSNVVYVAGELSSWAWAKQEIRGIEFDMVQGVVYKSKDGGEIWEAIWRGDNLARYVLINSDNVEVIYISTGIFDREAANSIPEEKHPGGEGILKSIDGGKTWEHVNNGLENLYVGSLAMHPENPDILLAATGNNRYYEGGGVYYTENGGALWERKPGASDYYVTAVEFSPSDPSYAYAAFDFQFYRSFDGGLSWSKLEPNNDWGYGWGVERTSPGFPIDIQVDPRDPLRIFVNNYGGGNFLSNDGGINWISASTGYSGAIVNDLAISPSNPAKVFSNQQNGPFVSLDGGVTWQGINPFEVIDLGIGYRVVVNPSDADTVLLSDHSGVLVVSQDGGKTWDKPIDYRYQIVDQKLENQERIFFQGFQAIAFASSDKDIVYAGFSHDRCYRDMDQEICSKSPDYGMYKSTDGGFTWVNLDASLLDNSNVSELIVHPTNPDIIWASTLGEGVYKSVDGGKSWDNFSDGLSSNYLLDITVDPKNPERLYVASFSNGLFSTEDGGKTWKQKTRGMNSNERIYSIAIDSERPNVLYAGSPWSGVYISEDFGETWRLHNDGLENRSIKTLAVAKDGNTLYAGTEGGGVFRLSVHNQVFFDALAPTPVPPTATPTIAASPTPSIATTEPVLQESSTSGDIDTPQTFPKTIVWILGATVLALVFLFVSRKKGGK